MKLVMECPGVRGQGSGRESTSRKQGTGEEAEPKVGGDILTRPWEESTVGGGMRDCRRLCLCRQGLNGQGQDGTERH